MHQTMRMQFFQHWLTYVMHSAYARVSIFVTLVTCWPAHANTGLTWISTSQVQHVNNLLNVVPFAAGRQCRHGGGQVICNWEPNGTPRWLSHAQVDTRSWPRFRAMRFRASQFSAVIAEWSSHKSRASLILWLVSRAWKNVLVALVCLFVSL